MQASLPMIEKNKRQSEEVRINERNLRIKLYMDSVLFFSTFLPVAYFFLEIRLFMANCQCFSCFLKS